MAAKKQKVTLTRIPGVGGKTVYRVDKVMNRIDPPVGDQISEAEVRALIKLKLVTVEIVRPRS